MKFLFTVLLTLVSLPVLAQVPGYSESAETKHLRFYWNEGAISVEGLGTLKRDGERHLAMIRELLEIPAGDKITVLIEGPGQRPDGSWNYPHVDGRGRVHLYQFGPREEDYTGAYAHELVHAVRIGRMPHHDWFFEEGLAEMIALRIDGLRGFPWYGVPVVIAAGQWLAAGEGLPLATLRRHHDRINLPCMAQSYTLRSSFFRYLGETYGDKAVLAMARQERAGALEDYEKFLGRSFDTLIAQWHKATLSAFNEIESREADAARYRNATAIRLMQVCDADGELRR